MRAQPRRDLRTASLDHIAEVAQRCGGFTQRDCGPGRLGIGLSEPLRQLGDAPATRKHDPAPDPRNGGKSAAFL